MREFIAMSASQDAPRSQRRGIAHQPWGALYGTPNLTKRTGMGRTCGGQPVIVMRGRTGCGRRTSRLCNRRNVTPEAGPEKRRDIMDRVIKSLYDDFCEDGKTR